MLHRLLRFGLLQTPTPVSDRATYGEDALDGMLVTEIEKLTRDKLGGAIAQDLSDILAPNTEGAKKSVPESLVASMKVAAVRSITKTARLGRLPPLVVRCGRVAR